MPAQTVFPLMLIRTAGLPPDHLEALAGNWQTGEKAVMVGQKRLKDSAERLQNAWDDAVTVLEESPFRTSIYNARKDFFKRQKLPSGTETGEWVIQGGNISEIQALLEALKQYHDARKVLNEAQNAFEKQYSDSLNAGYRRLQAIAAQDNFQRALLFASHTLLEQLPRFVQTPVEQFAKKERRIALTILQYATRMATKTSPLSRFTTVSVQKISPEPENPGAPQLHKTLVTPNVALLEAIYMVLLQEPVFYRSLAVRLNPCIISISETRYEWLFFNGEHESFQQTDATLVVTLVISRLLDNGREISFPELLLVLADSIDADGATLEKYVLGLIDPGLLEWVLPETGLSANWCGNLYQYLGFLPAEPAIVETAALLQWLRTTARTLPYSPTPADALAALRSTREQVHQYFEKHSCPAPPIPTEQLFFEDVEQPAAGYVPPEALSNLMDQLAACWQNRPDKPIPENRAALHRFFGQVNPENQPVGFLGFCRTYLERLPADQAAAGERLFGKRQEEDTCIGAMLQPFRENGQWHAVVNGLYPGGGKLFARWLHLFAAETRATLEEWITSESSPLPAAFPWQSWSNANFQPPLAPAIVAVPGGRTAPGKNGTSFLLGNLELVKQDTGIGLRERVSGKFLQLNDLGLEAPETRPPVMYMLWRLGAPYVSVEALKPSDVAQAPNDDTIRFHPRHIYGNLVLSRAAWTVPETRWKSWRTEAVDSLSFFTRIRQELHTAAVPRRFFARFNTEKPQYFDQDSPLLLLLFQKMLQAGSGELQLVEMLPVPEQGADDAWATEVVVEFRG